MSQNHDNAMAFLVALLFVMLLGSVYHYRTILRKERDYRNALLKMVEKKMKTKK